ncbi:MAG: hypothetical protein FWF01_00115 [Alphaproteobacteria bacterium]|nr:hypothetical protein [Alphaproteobacteria bacterium]
MSTGTGLRVEKHYDNGQIAYMDICRRAQRDAAEENAFRTRLYFRDEAITHITVEEGAPDDCEGICAAMVMDGDILKSCETLPDWEACGYMGEEDAKNFNVWMMEKDRDSYLFGMLKVPEGGYMMFFNDGGKDSLSLYVDKDGRPQGFQDGLADSPTQIQELHDISMPNMQLWSLARHLSEFRQRCESEALNNRRTGATGTSAANGALSVKDSRPHGQGHQGAALPQGRPGL